MKQLEKLLRISHEDFFAIYHEQRHLLVSSASPTNFNDALELSDIENYLASVPVEHGQIILVNHNTRPWADQFLKLDNDNVAGNIIDIQKLMKLLRNGTTAILGDMTKHIPKLNRYCEKLENELGVKLQANVYITPPKSKGYKVHIDSHDVFVLQLFGKKTWQLYEGLIEYPTKSLVQTQKEFSEKEHQLLAQIEMKPGDLLYVPQGMYHDAGTEDDPSIHITLGILPIRRSEVLRQLYKSTVDSPFFRRYIPRNLEDKSVQKRFIKEFKDACHQLIDETDLDGVLREISKQLARNQAPDLNGALSTSLTIEQLTVNSLLKRKPEVRYWLENEPWHTIVHFYQEKIQVPKPIDSVLDVILEKESFRPKDIHSDLSDKVKLDLVKKFVAGGILDIIKTE